MKFLTIFLAMLTVISLLFWVTDAAGSGMGYIAAGLAIGTAALLGVNKARTGQWLSDSAAGH